MVNLSNSAKLKPVVGIEWWDLFPEDLISSAAGSGFGFLTYNDNLLDGGADLTATARDGNGYPSGGEEPDTPAANRLSGPNRLAGYLKPIYSALR